MLILDRLRDAISRLSISHPLPPVFRRSPVAPREVVCARARGGQWASGYDCIVLPSRSAPRAAVRLFNIQLKHS